MIAKSSYGYKLVCDSCGYEVDGFDCFQEAVDYKKENGWKSKKVGEDEWEDNCTNCKEEGLWN